MEIGYNFNSLHPWPHIIREGSLPGAHQLSGLISPLGFIRAPSSFKTMVSTHAIGLPSGTTTMAARHESYY